MKDTQGRADWREVDLQRVGVKNVVLPIHIQQQAGGSQTVLATIRLSVDLPRQYKGTHMSRFIEILEQWKDQPSSSGLLQHILDDTRERLEADRAHLDARFKYFLTKQAPVSGQASTMGYECQFDAMVCREVGYDLVVGVTVPITTVCPCSKEISVAGAHNQRAWLRVKLRTVPDRFLWLEDLIQQLETFGSCEIYPLVKRPDEKYVTEKGYNNPKFVEDVLRDVVIWLRQHPLVTWFEVECEADESIHLHNAFAYQQEPQSALTLFSRDLTAAATDEAADRIAVAAASGSWDTQDGDHAAHRRPAVTSVSGPTANGKTANRYAPNGQPARNGRDGSTTLPDVASRHPGHDR